MVKNVLGEAMTSRPFAPNASLDRPIALPAPEPARRLAYVDNLRWLMVVLVISMHAADTYSPLGNWYYVERPPIGVGHY